MNCNAQHVEFETSWKKATKQSKKSGKPILAIFSHWRHKKMDETVFDNEEIVSKLKESFIIYKYYSRWEKSPWFIRGYPSVVISDYEGKRYKHIIHFQGRDSLLQSIYEYDTEPRLSYYEDNYIENENDIVFLEEYVRYSLKYNLGLMRVYYDYYTRLDTFNCLKVEVMYQNLKHALPTQEYLENYEEMKDLDCFAQEIENGLVTVFHRDFINQDRNDETRYGDYVEAANKTTEFLGEDSRFRDSVLIYYTWRHNSISFREQKSNNKRKKANSLLLDFFNYRLENIYTQDSLQSLLFNLSVSLDNRKELVKLSEIILNRPQFINDAAIVEVLAITFFRLDNIELGVKMSERCKEIALKSGVNYKSIIGSMRKKGLLKPPRE